jgi:hypothetical protein
MIVLKDYLSLKKDDVISFSTKGSSLICIDVENREIDVAFYGNDKGRFCKDNPAPRMFGIDIKDYIPNKHFKWIKEKVGVFTAIELKMPSIPIDLTKHLVELYNQNDWEQICIQKIIDEFKQQGII